MFVCLICVVGYIYVCIYSYDMLLDDMCGEVYVDRGKMGRWEDGG